MKVGEAFCILAMVGLCRAGSKLLKTPRIYNAFVTSDQKLLPSQAYPAIAPVVHGIHYPITSYIATPGLYHPIIPIPAYSSPISAVSPVSPVAPGGRSFSYAVKQDYYSYNYYENDPAYGAKVPVLQDPTQPVIYTPVGLQPLPKEALPYPAAEVRGDGKTEYQEEQQPQQDKAEAGQDQEEFEEVNSVAAGKGQRGPAPRLRGHPKYSQQPYPQQKTSPPQKAPEQQSYDESDAADDADEPGTEGENEEEANDQPAGPLVKNNRPKDPSIVDVPPEPLPIGKSKGKKKKPEEYPPSPVAFV